MKEGQITDNRDQRTEIRGQRSEDRDQRQITDEKGVH